MDNPVTNDKVLNLADQLGLFVDETLHKKLLNEIDQCKNLVDHFVERYDSHKKKLLVNIEQKSITGFLFESTDVIVDIKEMLENYVKESNNNGLHPEIINLHSAALAHFSIDNEIKSLATKLAHITFKKVQKSISDFIGVLLKKNKEDLIRIKCYQYSQLIDDVLRIHVEKIDDFENKRFEVLMNLWDKSKAIENNITVLSESKYDIESAKDKIRPDLEFEDTKKLVGDFEKVGKDFIQSIKAQLQSVFDNMELEKHVHETNMQKNRKKFRPDHIIRATRIIEKDYQKTCGKWHNTLLALSDDWILDLEISALKFEILKNYFSFINYIDLKLKDPLDEKMKSLTDLTHRLFVLFTPAEEGIKDDLIAKIKQQKLDFRRKLILRLIPDMKGLLLNSDLPKRVDEFEKNTAVQFESLSKSRLLIKNPVYNRPIEQSELQKISPNDLVSFNMKPEFMELFPALKNSLIRQLQALQEKLDEIPEIVDFSIESALTFFEHKKDLAEALKIGSEGIQRASNKIEDLSAFRRDFYTNEVDRMKDKIDHLFTKVSEITDNENALQIKIRITKAKALEQSKALRDKVKNNIKNFLPKFLNWIQSFYEYLVESTIKIRKKLEGETAKKFITSDVSDYLVETEEAVNRLPFVYQQLFKLDPLVSFDLYIERKEAYEKFTRAYSRWQSGKFAPVIINGEKGSGKTSFINRFLSSKSIHEQVIYHDLHEEYLEPEEAYNKVYESVSQVLSNQTNNNLDKPKRIVVVDGLERLFEAKINGFKVLQKTMQLISRSNNQIFWVVACHLYSYKFLERSFNVSEYFGYHIELEDLAADQLIKIIEKRHNISGFRLKFLADTQKKSMISKIKQSEKNDQLDLKAIYFDRLQKIVRGNITQAFLYWMRSAAEVTEDLIYINTQSDTKLDFIRSISLSKFEILKNILIHNGLSASKHSEIFRIPFEKSDLQLEQMYDDGIIIKRSDLYNINPMIYKQVIDQMYKLNLLH
jgi:hypothetical protein